MTPNDLDTRAREAAHAARLSVLPVERTALDRELHTTWPATLQARRGIRARLVAVGAATAMVAVAAALAFVSDDGSGDRNRVATAPPEDHDGQSPERGYAPPEPGLLPPGETVIATGAASDGTPWTLSMGGPSNDLCLHIRLKPPEDNIYPGACAGRPFGAPVPPEDRFLPMVLDDMRAPPFVFGRMPAGVVDVDVFRFTGEQLGGNAGGVIAGADGAFYVLEVPVDTKPDIVVGYRDDGTSVRYSRFCMVAPKPGQEVPASYVGSDQHVEDLYVLADVAPSELKDDLARFRAYIDKEVDPAEPESQLVENWPPEVQESSQRAQQFIVDNCS